MDEIRKLLAAAFLVLGLAGCSSSPSVRYYTLSPIDAEFHQDPDDATVLGLGPFRMPDYLNRSQIVTRGLNSEMQVDEFNRWSEPLATALLRIVSTDIDNLLPGVIVVVFPYEPFVQREQVKFRLVGDIARFDADHLGGIVLEVQWGITDAAGGMAVPVRRNRYQAQAKLDAGAAADPGSLATAMSDALAQFSRDVADKLGGAL